MFTVEALKSPDAAGAGAAAWADVTVEAVDSKTVRLILGTPIGGVLAAATQPLLPAHLLADVPFADLATSDFARAARGQGRSRSRRSDDRRATLVPASGVMPPVVGGPIGIVPARHRPCDSLATPFPRPSAGRARPYLDEVEVRFYDDEAALAAACGAARSMPRPGCPPCVAASSPRSRASDRFQYPTTTLSTVLLNLRPGHPELRDPKVRAGAARRRSTVTRWSSDVLGGTATRADALVPPTSWAFDAASAGRSKYDRKAAAKALQEAGWTKKGGKWYAPGAQGAVPARAAQRPAEREPAAWPRSAACVRDAWKAFGFDVSTVEARGRGPRDAGCARATSRPRSWTSPRASSRTCTRCSPPRRSAARVEPRRLPGPGPGPPAGGRPQAGDAARSGRPHGRRCWPRWRRASPSCRSPGTTRSMVARGSTGITPRLIADTGDRYWDVLAWRLAADR